MFLFFDSNLFQQYIVHVNRETNLPIHNLDLLEIHHEQSNRSCSCTGYCRTG